MSDTTLIFDGKNMAYRCAHRLNLSYRGIDTSVTFGVVRMIYTLMQRYEPQSVVVCWDHGFPAYRKEKVPSYKSNRDHSNSNFDYEGFMEQVYELQDMLPYFGICCIKRPDCEADDLMFHSSDMLKGKKVIVTSDHDMYQAIGPLTVVYSHTKELEVTDENFEEIVGYKHRDWYDVAMLIGDSGDGVPGVPGVGLTTAMKIINAGFPAINAVLAAQDGNENLPVSKKVVEALKEYGTEGCYRALGAIALYHDVCGARRAVKKAFSEWMPYDNRKVVKWLRAYGFHSLNEPEFHSACGDLRSPMESYKEPFAPLGKVRWPAVAPTKRTPIVAGDDE